MRVEVVVRGFLASFALVLVLAATVEELEDTVLPLKDLLMALGGRRLSRRRLLVVWLNRGPRVGMQPMIIMMLCSKEEA